MWWFHPSPDKLIYLNFHHLKLVSENVSYYPAELIYLNFHPLEVVFRYRDPQLLVSENVSHFFIWNQTFAIIDVWTHISFPRTVIWSSSKTDQNDYSLD